MFNDLEQQQISVQEKKKNMENQATKAENNICGLQILNLG